MRRAVSAQGWVGKVLILVLSGALFGGAVPGTAPHGSWGRCSAPTGEGTPLGCPGRQREPPPPPGCAHPSPLGAVEMLSPPASWQGSIQEALNSSHFFHRVGSLCLLMPRLPCVAPISDVIFIDGWNDLILIMCCLEVQYLRDSTVTASFRCIICLIQY